MKTILFGIIIILTLLLVWRFAQEQVYQQILHGYWEAPDHFCKEAGLQTCCIYLKDGKMYLYMDTPQNEVICNELLDIHTKMTFDSSKWSIDLKGENNPLPESLAAKYDPKGGMLTFFDEDSKTIFLELYKDSKATTGVA